MIELSNKEQQLMSELQRRFLPNTHLQIDLIGLIGSTSRDYVTQKYPDAEVRYVTNKARQRTHVGIYLTGGVDLDVKQHYSKEQNRLQLIGTLVPYKYGEGAYYIEHNAEAWTLAAMHVRKQHSETATDSVLLLFLDWLEEFKMPGFPHFKTQKE
jgi:hypothetical protein